MRSRVLFIVAILLVTTMAIATSNNVVSNGGFENGFTKWSEGRPQNGTYIVDKTDKFWGTASLKMEVATSDVFAAQRLITGIEGGSLYYFSCWAKTDVDLSKISNAALFVKVEWWDDEAYISTDEKLEAFFTNQVVENMGEWVRCSTVFRAPPEATRVSLLIRLKGAGARGWYDNIYLGLVPEPLVLNMGNSNYMIPSDQAELNLPLIVAPLPDNTSLKYKLVIKRTGAVIKEEDYSVESGVVDFKLDLQELELKTYILTMLQITDGEEEELFSVDLKKWDPNDDKPPLPPANIKADVIPGKVVLSWEVPDYSPDDDDLPDKYIIYRSERSGFKPSGQTQIDEKAGIEDVGAVLTYSDPLLGGNYYYIIASVDLAENYAYSQEIPVAVEGIAPPALTTENKDLFVDEEPIFYWEYLSRVSEYIIQLSRNDSFASDVTEYSVHPSNTSLSITDGLEAGVWYWRIMAKFSDETFSSFSTPYRFTYMLSEEGSNKISYLVIKPEIYNPKDGDLQIEVVLNDDSHVKLEIFSANGRNAAQVFDGRKPKGANIFSWNIANVGKTLGNGAYILKMTLDNGIQPTTAYKKFLIWYQ